MMYQGRGCENRAGVLDFRGAGAGAGGGAGAGAGGGAGRGELYSEVIFGYSVLF